MTSIEQLQHKIENMLEAPTFAHQDYLGMIAELVQKKEATGLAWQTYVDRLYTKVHEEIICNSGKPVSDVSFGTSGWRGILGKDLFSKSVAQVIMAIIEMYKEADTEGDLNEALGIESFAEACKRGCVVGFDNRFGGESLAAVAVEVLAAVGVQVYYAGETTTGALSAAVLQLQAAFSINFTPSHNPLQYAGLKFNAADGGPAAAELTHCITTKARAIIAENRLPASFEAGKQYEIQFNSTVEKIDSLKLWQKHVQMNYDAHGIAYDDVIEKFAENENFVVVVDSVHGASRLHIQDLFCRTTSSRLVQLRENDDVTFGGVAPEPSSENMIGTVAALQRRDEKLKLGAIIDPDGDRIRFTDGTVEISMNQFGAMAYHFLHEWKKKKGMVAKTVATSNLANSLATSLGEEVYEPRVGFKEFKPVINKALVCFEESDGISIIGHTPEKDAYIGLLLALDMIQTTGKNLGEYLEEIENTYGFFYPARDAISVTLEGEKLHTALAGLAKYQQRSSVEIGGELKSITKVIDVDGRKILFEDGSWLMIRPSGTEPKVRFYVESRSPDGTEALIRAAKDMLREVGLLS
ncbi:MAG: phosphoglucomutase [Desulfocapsaceae bacterium]|nr:phosphoglucomutase [Desulfocapsaceae bacterium]